MRVRGAAAWTTLAAVGMSIALLLVVAPAALAPSGGGGGGGGSTDPDEDPHVHDLWDGQTSVTILDRSEAISWSDELREAPETALRPAFIVDLRPREVDGTLVPDHVFPGTARMDVTLEWSGGQGPKTLCVTNRGASGHLCAAEGIGHTFDNGETWTIDDATDHGHFLNEDTWDDPHSLKSNWRFQVWLCTGGGVGQCLADTMVTDLELTVTIHRIDGDLPLGPPHFDHWADADRYDVLEETRISSAPIQSNWIGQAYQQATGRSRPYWYVSGFQLTHPPLDTNSELPLVPNGADRVEATLDVQALNAGTTPLQLKYRTAADVWSDPWRDAGDPCSDRCTMVIPVTAATADGHYAAQTQWEFAIFPGNPPSLPLVQYEVRLGIEVFGPS